MLHRYFMGLLLGAMILVTCGHGIERRQTSKIVSNHQNTASQFSSNDYKTVVSAIQELALDLSSSQWQRGNHKNLVISPLSISSLMSMLLLAARGNSHAELKRVLRYPNTMTDATVHETFQDVLGSLYSNNKDIELSVNSRLYLQEGLPILGTYTQVIQTLYNSQVRSLDFVNKPVAAKNAINEWVNNSTNGKISDLITKPFQSDTRFVAVNTVYFNGAWEIPFSKALTHMKGTFNTGEKEIKIPMMVNIMTVPFLNGDQIGFDMISLPYKGGKYEMLIMTPTGKAGVQSLQRLENSLYDSGVLERLVKRMKKTQVTVNLPRMKLKHKLNLKVDFQDLGVTSIFDQNKADFGRLTTRTGVHVEDIVHEAVIEITETGTVAAAATATSFDRIGGNEYFSLDKPSLILIREKQSGLLIFMARVVEPEPIL